MNEIDSDESQPKQHNLDAQRLQVRPESVEGLRPGTDEARSDVSRVNRFKNTETETSSRNSDAGGGNGGRLATTMSTNPPATLTQPHNTRTYDTHTRQAQINAHQT